MTQPFACGEKNHALDIFGGFLAPAKRSHGLWSTFAFSCNEWAEGTRLINRLRHTYSITRSDAYICVLWIFCPQLANNFILSLSSYFHLLLASSLSRLFYPIPSLQSRILICLFPFLGLIITPQFLTRCTYTDSTRCPGARIIYRGL